MTDKSQENLHALAALRQDGWVVVGPAGSRSIDARDYVGKVAVAENRRQTLP